MKKTIIKYLVVALVMVSGLKADFYSKRWAEQNLKGVPGVTVIRGVLDFGFAENRGMVFGAFNGKMNPFVHAGLTGVRVVILIALTAFIFVKIKSPILFLFPFLLFWAGAAGNLIDPFLYGYVVDFIHIRLGFLDWPYLFNLADAYITIGIAILILQTHVKKKNPTGSPG